jgi:hypothetical protein
LRDVDLALILLYVVEKNVKNMWWLNWLVYLGTAKYLLRTATGSSRIYERKRVDDSHQVTKTCQLRRKTQFRGWKARDY